MKSRINSCIRCKTKTRPSESLERASLTRKIAGCHRAGAPRLLYDGRLTFPRVTYGSVCFCLNERMEIAHSVLYVLRNAIEFARNLCFRDVEGKRKENDTHRATVFSRDPALCTPWPRIGRTSCRREPGKPEAGCPSSAAATSPNSGACKNSSGGSV